MSFACAVLAAVSLAWASGNETSPKSKTPEYSSKQFRKHVEFLSGDKLRGRGNGTPELEFAARYIADKFQEAGLEPAGDQGTFFQRFSMTIGSKLIGRNELTYYGASGATPLKVKKEYVPISFSADGTFDTPLVFAGYGITAPEYHYDDYAGLDVRDKVVIVLRHEPQEFEKNSVFDGKDFTAHSEIIKKAINARNHGATGMLLVNDTGNHSGKDDDLIPFGTSFGPEEMKFAALHVKTKEVDEWLKPTGKGLDQLRRAIDKDLSNQSFDLGAASRLKFSIGIERTRRDVPNVVGLLRGSDPQLREQAIVIGAHYDHLGLGEQHSLAPNAKGRVHYGADDNASGTSGLLELAAGLGRRRGELKRSFVFIAFAGEESGLLGSNYYTRFPAVSMEQTIAMLNMDMIGRVSRHTLYIGGTGTSPDFKQMVENANRDVGFEIKYSGSGYGSSDHMSFTVRQVPVVFFFSGLHADYHKPSDTWEKIDADEGVKVVQLAAAVAVRLDQVKEKPLYVRVAEPSGHGMGGGGGYGPYFGSIPDMAESSNGVKFSDVRDGSPAAKAGLRGGDVMVEFAGKKIENLYDFTYALREQKVGDKVRVTVVRNGQRLTREVTLETRK